METGDLFQLFNDTWSIVRLSTTQYQRFSSYQQLQIPKRCDECIVIIGPPTVVS